MFDQGSNLVDCPKCGNDVKAPVKTWPVLSKESLKEGEEPRLVCIFECPNCKARFRYTLETGTELEETVNIKNVVERVRGAKGEFMQTLMNLREKINKLESERASLVVEIENLRKVAASRVETLESEVGALRSEVESLRELLGYKEEEKQ